MSAELIDQANELAERRLEMTIQNMRINHNAVSATHCHDCGEEIPSGAEKLWLVVSAALTVRKSLKNVVSTGGDACKQLSRLSQTNGFQRTC